MDKVTQQNSAGAEESSSAAEELTAQAATVKGMVSDLMVVINGSGSSTSQGPSTHKVRNRLNVNVAHVKKPRQPAPVGAGFQTAPGVAKATDESPESFMSLDDKDIKGF